MSEELGILSRLLPSLPKLKEMFQKIRRKHQIPEVLPENEQLAETLAQERTLEKWETMRQEIEKTAATTGDGLYSHVYPLHHAVHQLWPVLQCLRQMRGLDLFTPCQIRDCARQFQ